MFGYPFEQSQMDVSTAQPDFGGDPKARRALAEVVTSADYARTDGVARISRKFDGLPEFSQMKLMHDYVKEISVVQPPSATIVTNLAEMARRGSV